MNIRVIATEADIAAAFPLMHELRERLTPETFVEVVRQQRRDGYVMAGGYVDGKLVTLAGFREGRTLSRGPHLFVDDLVTDPLERGKGHGQAMVVWLRRRAAEMNLPVVWLDSRVTAKGFYERCGFTMNTSIPCWICSKAEIHAR
jgi:GNAT superfamily N-acetyltransferase